jgi:transcriptional regulator of met regulon
VARRHLVNASLLGSDGLGQFSQQPLPVDEFIVRQQRNFRNGCGTTRQQWPARIP